MIDKDPRAVAEDDFVDFTNKCFNLEKSPVFVSIDMQEKFLESIVRNKNFLVEYNKRMFELCAQNQVKFLIVNTENFKFGNNIFGFSEQFEKFDTVGWINKPNSNNLSDVDVAGLVKKMGGEAVFVMGVYRSNSVLEQIAHSDYDFFITTSFAGLCTRFKDSLDLFGFFDKSSKLKGKVKKLSNLTFRG